jgi:hypothetical protein
VCEKSSAAPDNGPVPPPVAPSPPFPDPGATGAGAAGAWGARSTPRDIPAGPWRDGPLPPGSAAVVAAASALSAAGNNRRAPPPFVGANRRALYPPARAVWRVAAGTAWVARLGGVSAPLASGATVLVAGLAALPAVVVAAFGADPPGAVTDSAAPALPLVRAEPEVADGAWIAGATACTTGLTTGATACTTGTSACVTGATACTTGCTTGTTACTTGLTTGATACTTGTSACVTGATACATGCTTGTTALTTGATACATGATADDTGATAFATGATAFATGATADDTGATADDTGATGATAFATGATADDTDCVTGFATPGAGATALDTVVDGRVPADAAQIGAATTAMRLARSTAQTLIRSRAMFLSDPAYAETDFIHPIHSLDLRGALSKRLSGRGGRRLLTIPIDSSSNRAIQKHGEALPSATDRARIAE